MKPPISYYGGKQRMLKHLKEMIPDHALYVEPFLGGGALFWEKEPSEAEVINDLDDNVVNFYRVMQTNWDELYQLMQTTLHSRSQHQAARYVLKQEEDKLSETYTYYLGESNTFPKDVQKAWAFWMQTNMSYSAKLFGGFAYCRSDKTTKAVINKRERFQEHYKERLSGVCIECNDAIKVIESRDTIDSFIYCDPPYFNSNCGHYAGYSEEDFKKLLTTLSGVEGKFLLSSYPSELLTEYTKQSGWNQKEFIKYRSAGNNSGTKTEVLTWNY